MAAAVRHFDLYVRLRQQRYWLNNQDVVQLCVTANQPRGTSVLAMYENRHERNNVLVNALGYVDNQSWAEFLEQYYNDVGIANAQRSFGGPRVGEHSKMMGGVDIHPLITDAYIIGVPGGTPLAGGAHPYQNNNQDHYWVTVRVEY